MFFGKRPKKTFYFYAELKYDPGNSANSNYEATNIICSQGFSVFIKLSMSGSWSYHYPQRFTDQQVDFQFVQQTISRCFPLPSLKQQKNHSVVAREKDIVYKYFYFVRAFIAFIPLVEMCLNINFLLSIRTKTFYRKNK